MTITPIAQVSADAGSGNPSIAHGLTILSGDKLIAFVNANGTANTVIDNNGATPFSETTHGDNPSPGSARMYIFEREAGSSEPSSYNFTLGTSNRWSMIICQYRGVDAAIWDVAPSDANKGTDDFGGTTSTCPAINILTSGALGIVAMGDDFNPITTAFSSVDNGYGNVKSETGQQYMVVAEKAGLSTGSTGATVITSDSTVRTVQWQMALKPSAAISIDQEGFRFRNDDGSESAASWLANQDVNISKPALVNTRLRILVNATGDPASQRYKLRYRKVGDDGWRDLGT